MNVPTSTAVRAPTSRVNSVEQRALVGAHLHAALIAEDGDGLLVQGHQYRVGLGGVGRDVVEDRRVEERMVFGGSHGSTVATRKTLGTRPA